MKTMLLSFLTVFLVTSQAQSNSIKPDNGDDYILVLGNVTTGGHANWKTTQADMQAFMNEVQEKINDGYKPQGGAREVIINNLLFYQQTLVSD